MGILIPKLSMPRSCGNCPFFDRRTEYPDSDRLHFYCRAMTRNGREISGENLLTGRDKKCVLVEVANEQRRKRTKC